MPPGRQSWGEFSAAISYLRSRAMTFRRVVMGWRREGMTESQGMGSGCVSGNYLVSSKNKNKNNNDK